MNIAEHFELNEPALVAKLKTGLFNASSVYHFCNKRYQKPQIKEVIDYVSLS